jgi:hypothetical protein
MRWGLGDVDTHCHQKSVSAEREHIKQDQSGIAAADNAAYAGVK